jgi:YfiH family protein
VAVHRATNALSCDASGAEPRADAAVTCIPGRVLAILTADCLPVLLADRSGRRVGAAHAGWRGLAAGVIEQTVAALRDLPGDDDALVAWLGPAIGPEAFEVGDEVLEAFVAHDAGARACFRPREVPGKWFADLYALARRRLAAVGVGEVGGGGFCTVTEPQRFYSHRRDRTSGRMASLIWIKPLG